MTQMTNVPDLDSTVQKTNEWLGDLSEALDVDRETAYGALRATLWSLRDSMTAHEASDLAAELPMLIRGAYYSGWSPANEPKRMDVDELFERIRSEGGLGADGPHPQAAARAVVQLLRRHVADGEVDDVIGHLTSEVQDAVRIETD